MLCGFYQSSVAFLIISNCKTNFADQQYGGYLLACWYEKEENVCFFLFDKISFSYLEINVWTVFSNMMKFC